MAEENENEQPEAEPVLPFTVTVDPDYVPVPPHVEPVQALALFGWHEVHIVWGANGPSTPELLQHVPTGVTIVPDSFSTEGERNAALVRLDDAVSVYHELRDGEWVRSDA
jgi:hypothetical protein